MNLEEVKTQIKLKSFQHETEDGLLKDTTVKLVDVLNILDGLLILPVVVWQSEQLAAFVEWHNENYPENYIPNSRIGLYNISC